jgi:hypothetical protein
MSVMSSLGFLAAGTLADARGLLEFGSYVVAALSSLRSSSDETCDDAERLREREQERERERERPRAGG